MTVEECKEACEAEETFHCNSFDYLIASKNCYLARVTRMKVALTKSTSYEYYERNCIGTLWLS